nr:hypothetical protein [Tanacetum cinerariifolium]
IETIQQISKKEFSQLKLDRETNCCDFWTSSIVTVCMILRGLSLLLLCEVMVKMTVEFLRLMLQVLAVFVYCSMFLWVLKLFQGSGLNFAIDCVVLFLPFQGKLLVL